MPKTFANINGAALGNAQKGETAFVAGRCPIHTLWRVNFRSPHKRSMCWDVCYLGGTNRQSDVYNLYDEYEGDLTQTIFDSVDCEIRPLALKELDPFLKEAWPRNSRGEMIRCQYYDDHKFFSPSHVARAIKEASKARRAFYGREEAS